VKKDELIDWQIGWILGLAVAIVILSFWGPRQALGHEIYTGVHGKNGQLCCGSNDCSVTVYRETGDKFEFLTRENHWVNIPEERITFLPIPGDVLSNTDYRDSPNGDELHRAHLCYRQVMDVDAHGAMASNVMIGDGQNIYLYCAFIPPGAI
jgi:hypothetical protein